MQIVNCLKTADAEYFEGNIIRVKYISWKGDADITGKITKINKENQYILVMRDNDYRMIAVKDIKEIRLEKGD